MGVAFPPHGEQEHSRPSSCEGKIRKGNGGVTCVALQQGHCSQNENSLGTGLGEGGRWCYNGNGRPNTQQAGNATATRPNDDRNSERDDAKRRRKGRGAKTAARGEFRKRSPSPPAFPRAAAIRSRSFAR